VLFFLKTKFVEFLLNINSLIKCFSFDRKTFLWIIALNGPKFVKKIIAKKFLSKRNIVLPGLSYKWKNYLNTLKKEGYVLIEKEFLNSANKILKSIDENFLYEYKKNDNVIDYEFDLGFSFPGVMETMANENLCNLICSYYNRQGYYREHPEIMSHSSAEIVRSSEYFHVDGYRQLTIYLMLSDMNIDTSQIYVSPRSHKDIKYDLRRLKNRKLETEKVIPIEAKKGDLLIFDAGSLFHKGFSRDQRRIIMHFVATSGWLPTKDYEKYDKDYLKMYLKNPEKHVESCFNGFL